MKTSVLAFFALIGLAWNDEGFSQETLLPVHEGADSYRPSLACGKGTYLVVWQAGRNEKADLVGLRLDASGKPVEVKPFLLSAAPDGQERPRVAFGGGIFLVVWHDLRNGKDFDVWATRVSPEGKVLDPEGILVAGGERNQCEPGVSWDGRNFQVLWRAFVGEREDAVGVGRLPSAGYHIFGGRVSAEGKVLDGAGVFMAKPPRQYLTPRGLGMPTALRRGEGELLAQARSGVHVCLWRIADGKPVGEPAVLSDARGFDDGAFATDGKTVLLAWTTFRDGGGRSSGVDKSGLMILGGEGNAQPAPPLSLSSAKQEPRVRHPSPVWDGKRFLVAWDAPVRRHGKEFPYEAVFLRRFAADGTPLDEDEPLAGDPERPACRPASASDGAGRTVIAYERHPKSGDDPIRIAVRVLAER